uniref:Uncharacterized protein n=1 Tax=Arundo donax TaxID=35708 RepID=A0A0A9H155_ARUDO
MYTRLTHLHFCFSCDQQLSKRNGIYFQLHDQL